MLAVASCLSAGAACHGSCALLCTAPLHSSSARSFLRGRFALLRPRPFLQTKLLPYLDKLAPHAPIVGVHLRSGFADWQSKAAGSSPRGGRARDVSRQRARRGGMGGMGGVGGDAGNGRLLSNLPVNYLNDTAAATATDATTATTNADAAADAATTNAADAADTATTDADAGADADAAANNDGGRLLSNMKLGEGGVAAAAPVSSSSPWTAAAAAARLPYAQHWRMFEDILHDCEEPQRPAGARAACHALQSRAEAGPGPGHAINRSPTLNPTLTFQPEPRTRHPSLHAPKRCQACHASTGRRCPRRGVARSSRTDSSAASHRAASSRAPPELWATSEPSTA